VWILSPLVGRLTPFPCCPGKKEGAEAKKGREILPRFLLSGFRKPKRMQRDFRAETARTRYGKRGIASFFGEANAFLRGQGTLWQYGIISIRRNQ